MTQADVLKSWADRWRSLAAWGGQVSMLVEIKPDNGCGVLGLARPGLGHAYVKDTGDLAQGLKTILHELAHLAAPSFTHHSRRWRLLFVLGACEALDCDVEDFELDVTLADLNRQVEEAVATWLDRSGQTVVLKAIGVL